MATSYGLMDLVSGEFAETTRADLAAVFASLNERQTRSLVIHFHGGLISRAAARKIADTLVPRYGGQGVSPLFVAWNTDLGTTLRENLARIATESIFWTLVSRVRSLVKWKDAAPPPGPAGGRSGKAMPAIRLPAAVSAKRLRDEAGTLSMAEDRLTDISPAETRAMEAALKQDLLLRRRVRELAPVNRGARGGASGRARPTLMSPEVLRRLTPSRPGSRSIEPTSYMVGKIIEVVAAVIRRYRRKSHHGLYTTIVEEVLRAFYVANVGRAVWSAMKKNTVLAFKGSPEQYGGTALLEELAGWWAPGKRITLVAHSAGSLFVLELLKAAAERAPALRFNLVLLAPACTFDRFSEGLAEVRARVEKLLVFSLNDKQEAGYWEVPGIYNASLLYLVSGLFEKNPDQPILGMQRYFSGQRPYKQRALTDIGDYLRGHLAWSPSRVAPQRLCEALKHGDFDNEQKTLESLADIVTRGIA